MNNSTENTDTGSIGSVRERLDDYLAVAKPVDLSILSFAAGYFRDLGNNDDAIYAFSKIIELEPEQMPAFCNRGEVYLKKNDYDNALGDFTRVIEGNPEARAITGCLCAKEYRLSVKKR